MVRRAKYEDSLDGIRSCDVLISPGCSRAAEVESSVRVDQAFHPIILLILLTLGPVDVLPQLCAELIRCIR